MIQFARERAERTLQIRSLRDLYQDRWWLRLAAMQSLCWLVLLFGSFTGQKFIYFEF